MNKVPGAILPIILGLVLLLAGCSAGPEPSGARVGGPAPNFQFQNLEGQNISLSDLQGEPVLINFWATWCRPCVLEMPYLQEIYEERSDAGLILLAINMGESPAQIEDFMRNYNLSLPVMLDTNRFVAQMYNITGIPTTFFIDKDGIIQEKKVGAFRHKEEIESYLDKIIP